MHIEFENNKLKFDYINIEFWNNKFKFDYFDPLHYVIHVPSFSLKGPLAQLLWLHALWSLL